MKEVYFKYKIFLTSVIAGIICLVTLGFVIYPQVIGYLNEKNKIQTLKSSIEILNNKSAELQKINEETSKKKLTIALTVLPADLDVPMAMSSLQSLIAKSNLVLNSTAYSPQSKSKENNNFMFTISVVGSLPSIKSFLGDLQNGTRIYKVESIAMNYQPTSSLIEANIPLLVYYKPIPDTLLTIQQPLPVISEKDEQLIEKLSSSISQTEVVSTSSAVPLGKIDPFE